VAEYVMTQVESPTNLDRWPNPTGRLVTVILTRCGLRISSALALDFDCLAQDGQQAPYLRYFNTKMKREAAVPIDEELQAAIREQQRRVLDRWPDGSTCLFPRPHANISGNLPLSDSSYRSAHLAEPADTAAARGRKRRAKTDRADARLIRELLAGDRVPECWIPPSDVLEHRALLELYHDLRRENTGWIQRIHAVLYHQGAERLPGIGTDQGRQHRGQWIRCSS
jgi:hypothetical protein